MGRGRKDVGRRRVRRRNVCSDWDNIGTEKERGRVRRAATGGGSVLTAAMVSDDFESHIASVCILTEEATGIPQSRMKP